jgi:hypothetical protein
MGKAITRDQYELAEEIVTGIDPVSLEGDNQKDRLLELQLTMATTSINHEYAALSSMKLMIMSAEKN